MKTRKLGTKGPEITEIGFGAWAIGGPWAYGWGPVDDSSSIRAIHKALDLGINWIDTAAIYGLGHSEEVTGKALRGNRKKIFLATKCGMVWDEKRNVRIHAFSASIRKEIENSLRRLGTEFVDLYQIHWPDPLTPAEESWETLAAIQREGKARYIGVCNYDVPLLKKCMAIAPVQSLQPPYSLLKRDIEKEILPYCLKEGIGVVAYSPMQSGLLSGKFDKTRLAPDDWRQKGPYFNEPALSKNLKFVEAIRPIAKKYEMSVGELAIAWVLHNPAVTSAIVGARTDQQITETSGAVKHAVSKEDIAAIERYLKEIVG